MKERKERKERKPRSRRRLLVLFWVWAICMFVVLDLFKNIAEFDAIRPRSDLYSSMRYAAHKMVNEPYLEGGFPGDSIEPLHSWQELSDDEKEMIRVNEDLAELEGDWQEPGIEGMIRLGKLYGVHAQKAFEEVARDERETEAVRAQAARLLGTTGHAGGRSAETALAALDDLIRDEGLSLAIRNGAVLGLGELDTRPAAERLLRVAADEDSPFQESAIQAAERIMYSAESCQALLRALGSDRQPDRVRIAACRFLTEFPSDESVAKLAAVLGDPRASEELRSAAATALGKVGLRGGSEALAKASKDESPEVSSAARRASRRLAAWRSD